MADSKHTRESEGPVLVSACLLGLRTRWDGADRRSESVLEKVRGRWVIAVCPEQLGGLPTPRPPAEISQGDGQDVLDGQARVVSKDGRDVTENYLRGAHEVLKLADTFAARRAILKDGSPACGTCRIRRAGQNVPGLGVTAALLERQGIVPEGAE